MQIMLQNDHPRKKIHSLFFKQVVYTNSLRKSRYLSLLLGFITYTYLLLHVHHRKVMKAIQDPLPPEN